jgi:DNA helicase-2/ATP-dependent DNA helicase PcrA
MLDEVQQRVVDHHEGPLLVHAGPGSGKTRTIIERCSSLVASGIPPYSILVVTFTREAASEIRRRVENYHQGSGICMMTIHALGYLILRELLGKKCPTLIDDAEAEGRYSAACRKAGRFPSDDGYLDIVRVKANFHGSKDPVFLEYVSDLSKRNEMDLSDLVTMSYLLLSKNGRARKTWADHWSYVTIDEAHDCTPIEARLINILSGENLCIVFDENQSIYGWRGGSPEAVKRMREFANYQLPYTYRCASEVYDPAWNLMRRFTSQQRLLTRGSGGEVQILDNGDPIGELVKGGHSMVLCRTQEEVESIETDLTGIGIPVNKKGGVFDSYEAKVVLAYARAAAGQDAWEQVLRNPFQERSRRLERMARRATYRKPLEAFLEDWRIDHFRIDPTAPDRYWSILGLCTGNVQEFIKRLEDKQTPTGNVRVMTIHGSKGLEEDRVILYNVTDGNIPHRKESDVGAERRLLYVGMTRARRELVILTDQRRPSQFLVESGLVSHG